MTERPYHHGDLRNALLEAGRAALIELPIERISLREIARRAGVSHAAPYRHFASQRELFLALALEGFTELEYRVSNRSGPARNAAFCQFTTERPVLALLMFLPFRWNGTGSPDLTKAIADLAALMGEVALCSCVGATLLELQGFGFKSTERSAAA